MALQVWLPLNGNLNNQGLTNITVTNSGATVDNNGKIGKCYYFDGTDDRISCSSLTIKYPMTVTGWFKPTNVTASATQYWISYNTNMGGTDGHSIGIGTYNGVPAVWYNGGVSNLSTSLSNNVWYHIAVTIDENKKVVVYLNGASVATFTSTSTQPNSTWITLGARSNSSTGGVGRAAYYYKGYMNDARVYDSCLPPKEIEILSRGLVAHYPLSDRSNQTPNNVFTNSTFASSSSWNFWGQSGHSGTWNFTQNKDYIFNKTQTNACVISNGASATGDYLMYQFPAFSGGFRSLQAIIKEENSRAITDSIAYPVWNASASGSTPLNHWTNINGLGDGFYLCRCESIKQDGSNNLVGIYVKPGYKIYVSECYCENDRTVCSDFFYPSTTVYDTSGYQNNGTTYRYDTNGLIECSADTARYSKCTYVNSSNNTVNNITGTTFVYCDCKLTTPNYLTVAFWCKPIAGYGGGTGNGQFCTTSSDLNVYNAGADYATTAMHNRDGYIDMCTSTNVHKTLNISFTASEWHHYVIVYDGRYGKTYKDGVLQSSTLDMGSTLSLASFNAVMLGYSRAGGVFRKNKTYYSDLRIYATALSAAQVAELYNTAVSVANNGALLGYELVEV